MRTIILFRHGLAVEVGERGVADDASRMLSAEGVRRTTKAARGLRGLGCRPQRIVSSPLVRAAETAAIAAGRLLDDRDVEFSDLLKPGRSVRALADWVLRQKEESILLVGHSPDLEALAARLLTGGDAPFVRLRKAGACCVALDPQGGATLEWLLTSSQLRDLA